MRNRVPALRSVPWLTAALIALVGPEARAENCSPAGNTRSNGQSLQYCDGSSWVSVMGTAWGSCSGSGQVQMYGSDFLFCDGSRYWAIQGKAQGSCSVAGSTSWNGSLVSVCLSGTSYSLLGMEQEISLACQAVFGRACGASDTSSLRTLLSSNPQGYSALVASTQQTMACQITLSSCPSFPGTVGTFADNYENSSSNAGRCMQRAADFSSWCGGGVSATANYYSGGAVAQNTTYTPPPPVLTEFAVPLPSCNAVALDQVPAGFGGWSDNHSLFAGRQTIAGNGSCDESQGWKLVLSKMDWNTHGLNVINDQLFNVPQTIYGGYTIRTAYDPTLLWAYNELWVAFECADLSTSPDATGTAACMGPIITNGDSTGASWRVDPARTTVVVKQNHDDTYNHSASVPKIFFWRGIPYMYYSLVHFLYSNAHWVNASTRGIALRNTNPNGGGIFWEINSSGPVGAVDSHSTEVMKMDAGDPHSNQIADGFGVYTDGPAGNETAVYMTGALGGTSNISCMRSPMGLDVNSVGCYRPFIARATQPLGEGIFNDYRVSERDGYLPNQFSQYVRRFFDNHGYSMVWANYLAAPAGTPYKVIPNPNQGLMYAYRLDLSSLDYQPNRLLYGRGQLTMTAGDTRYLANGKLVYQSDGNLVLYNVFGAPLWSIGYAIPDFCSGHLCQVVFQQDDGNFVAYRDGVPYWSTATNPDGAYVHFGIRADQVHFGIFNSSWQWLFWQ